ncbi:MarR family winged helix-turn-helix transcriptional regulator [Aestuariivirga sp.]|uniref:MarR family winged helix-turn-helix transcriptional regulator n=1 Tax=Aestuariivirga sp. TaxID=2650926 RepID=UPI0039E470A0
MSDDVRSPAENTLTDLILTLFRVNNLTLTWGDRMVAPLGLTSARWQILGVIAYAERPQPVAWLARDLGASRQNVQRIVNALEQDDIVAFEPNPHHKRANLVVLTQKGRQVYDEALRLYAPRANALCRGIVQDDLDAARRVMVALKTRLEANLDDEEQA